MLLPFCVFFCNNMKVFNLQISCIGLLYVQILRIKVIVLVMFVEENHNNTFRI